MRKIAGVGESEEGECKAGDTCQFGESGALLPEGFSFSQGTR